MKTFRATQACLLEVTGIVQFFAIIAVLLFSLFQKQVHAETHNWSYELLGASHIPVWWKATPAPSVIPILHTLDEDLEALLSHPWFQRTNGLPHKWGVLVDGEWTKSSGFFSAELITPDGSPAVLFSTKALLDTTRARSILAHELTHLMHQRFRPREESWIREGVALLAEFKLTGKYNPALGEAFFNPETSLTAPLDPRHQDYARLDQRTAQYGHLLQYFIYLHRLCGGNRLLAQLLTSPSENTGVAFVDETLKNSASKSPACRSFRESFRAFSLARFQQSITTPESYVLISSLRATLRDQRKALPPFSSTAYRLKDGAHCQPDEVSWGSSRCIRIRME